MASTYRSLFGAVLMFLGAVNLLPAQDACGFRGKVNAIPEGT